MADFSRAAGYGSVPLQDHLAISNSEIVVAVMVEDKEAIAQLEDIASIDGLDLIAIGPFDLAQSLGITESRHPQLEKTIEHIALTLKKLGKARMTFPLNNPIFPLDAAGLQRLGVAYTNCGPPDVRRLFTSFRQQVQDIQSRLAAINQGSD